MPNAKAQSTVSPTSPQPATERQLVAVALIGILLIGAFPRLYFALTSPLPLHDGGLFYTMTRDLLAAGFALPAVTSYNLADIPFTYPPLGFYLAGALAAFTRWPLMEILRLLPPVVSLLSLPAFFRFARLFLKDDLLALFACLAFATLPPAFNWFIMGGGLTRAWGLLFALLALSEMVLTVQTAQKWRILTAGIFIGLTMLSHPGEIWFVAHSGLFLALTSERKWDGLLRIALAGFTAALLTSPWWLAVLRLHGLAPFFSVGGNAFEPLVAFFSLLFLQFTIEPLLQIWALIGLLGCLISLGQRRFRLPLWLLVIALAQGRAWQNLILIPFSLLAAIGLQQLLLILNPPIARPAPAETDLAARLGGLFSSLPARLGITYLLVASLISAFMGAPQTGLSQPQVEAMTWVATNTPAGSTFAVVTGDTTDDPVSEWFPALTGRISQATLQGYEWQGQRYAQRLPTHAALQACALETAACLETWSKTTGQSFEYVYVVAAPITTYATQTLRDSLKASASFQQIYASPNAEVFLHLAER